MDPQPAWAQAGKWPCSSSICTDTAFLPDGSLLYVAHNFEVAVFTPTGDVNSPLQATGSINVDGTTYRSVAVSTDGKVLYVCSSELIDFAAGNFRQQIQAFHTSDLSLIGALQLSTMFTSMVACTGTAGSYLFAADTSNYWINQDTSMQVFTITGDSSNPFETFGAPFSIASLIAVRISPPASTACGPLRSAASLRGPSC